MSQATTNQTLEYLGLTEDQFTFQQIGIALLRKTQDLSERVRQFVVEAKGGYDWTAYKRDQRSRGDFNPFQNLLAYQEQQRKQKALREEIANLLKDSPYKDTLQINAHQDHDPSVDGETKAGSNVVESLVSPYSPIAGRQAELRQSFLDWNHQNEEDRLPWKAIMIEETQTPTEFDRLQNLHTKRAKALGLGLLLQMANDGLLSIDQDRPFDKIRITPTTHISTRKNQANIKITKKDGKTLKGNWLSLSHSAKEQIKQDAKAGDIIVSYNGN